MIFCFCLRTPYTENDVNDFVFLKLHTVIILFICLFLQLHTEEINSLPDVLAGVVSLLPELLTENRAPNTAETYKNLVKNVLETGKRRVYKP